MSDYGADINVEPSEKAEYTPAEKAAKAAEEKVKISALFGVLKNLLDGKSGLKGQELEVAKAEIAKQIAECLEYEDD